jgi:hypothetical protein
LRACVREPDTPILCFLDEVNTSSLGRRFQGPKMMRYGELNYPKMLEIEHQKYQTIMEVDGFK